MQALSKLKDAVGDRVILTAGKMHASGIISEAGEKILTEKDIVDFIKVSHKISEFELFISILYYSEGYIKDICEDYPKAIRKYIGNIENYKTINAKKDLIQIIFGERINNSELLTYIDIDTILDDLHTIKFEDKIYLFNSKQ